MADGTLWKGEIPITSDSEKREELMRSDYVSLSWNAPYGDVIPAGSYIDYTYVDGHVERYSLLEPHYPERKTEVEWTYRPSFQSWFQGLSKVPFFMYTHNASGSVTGRETDWSLTDTPQNFMSAVCKAIRQETGEVYSYEVAEGLKPFVTLAFSNIDILSVLSSIAEAFETEWWVEKDTHVIHLSKAVSGYELPLEVGVNIGVPSISSQAEFYNRFYVFGSTRNIVQDYQGASVNNIVNRRLTLDPARYPSGYMDFSGGGKVFSCMLYYDDIYPSATGLYVASVVRRRMYVLDSGSGGRIRIGVDAHGNPIYDTYYIYYLTIRRRASSGATYEFLFNDSVYDAVKNLGGMLLPGQPLSVSFTSGTLQGRDFEVTYYRDAMRLSSVDGDVSIPAASYELNYIHEGTYILPSDDLRPHVGDTLVPFNCHIPPAYTDDAYDRLEARALKDIAENFINPATLEPVDRNQYRFRSNAVAFHASDPMLVPGRAVRFRDGVTDLSTRVLSISFRLDRPSAQEITVGNERMKGSLEELREQIEDEGKDIEMSRWYSDRLHTKASQFTRRMYEDAEEAAEALINARLKNFSSSINPIVVKTMQLIAGDESLQFLFYTDRSCTTPLDPFTYDSDARQLRWSACVLRHMTLGLRDITGERKISDYLRWNIRPDRSPILDQEDRMYYVYAKVDSGNDGESHLGGEIILSEDPIEMEEVADNYHFLVGILNSESEGDRSFATTYGFTEVLPGQINTDRIQSTGANDTSGSWLDLTDGSFSFGGGSLTFINGQLVLRGVFTQSGTGSGLNPITNYRGTYDASATYYKNDIVAYTVDGKTQLYIYTSSVAGNALPSDVTKWTIAASSGSDGEKGEKGEDGEKGADGADGADGVDGADGNGIEETIVEYGVSENAITKPTEWSKTLPTEDELKPGMWLWVRMTIRYTDPDAEDTVTYSKAYQGLDGEDGKDGKDGDRGPAIIFRGEYEDGSIYYGSPDRVDVIRYDNFYYIAQPTAGTIMGINPDDDPTGEIWKGFGAQFESVATDLLVADQASINNLTVNKVRTSALNDNGNVVIADNEMHMYDNEGAEKLFIHSGDLSNPEAGTETRNLLAFSGSAAGITFGSEVRVLSGESGNLVTLSSSNLTPVPLTVAAGNTVTLPSTYVQLDLSSIQPGASERLVRLSADLCVDGMAVSHGYTDGIWPPSAGTWSLLAPVPGRAQALTPGSHAVSVRWSAIVDGGAPDRVAGYNVHSIRGDILVVYSGQKVEIAKNGMRAVFGDSSHVAEFTKTGGITSFMLRSGDSGVRVTDSGLEFLIGGTWRTAGVTTISGQTVMKLT